MNVFIVKSPDKSLKVSCGVLMKCCANCWDKSNSSCLSSHFFYHRPVCLQGILSINIKAKLTLTEHSDVELCSKKLLSYENTEGVPLLLCMLILPAFSLHIQRPALVQWHQEESGETNQPVCIPYRGSAGVKSWLLYSLRVWKTEAEDLSKKCQRKHLLPWITTEIAEAGDMPTCWEGTQWPQCFSEEWGCSRNHRTHAQHGG